MAVNPAVVLEAAAAVIGATDFEATFYDGQSAVEDWALEALHCAISGNNREAKKLLRRYKDAPFDHNECPDNSRHDPESPLHHRRWFE